MTVVWKGPRKLGPWWVVRRETLQTPSISSSGSQRICLRREGGGNNLAVRSPLVPWEAGGGGRGGNASPDPLATAGWNINWKNAPKASAPRPACSCAASWGARGGGSLFAQPECQLINRSL